MERPVAKRDVSAADDSRVQAQRRYRAPALEKGLDILQLLAEEPRPLSLGGIVQRLGRSHGELFRMVQVLHYRGFIDQDPETDGFYLTDLLFSMAMRQPKTQSLVDVALPVMRRISAEAGQSCHLAIYARGDMIIIARMESSEHLGFSVRIGYRKPIAETASGTVLYAFQPPDVRECWSRLVVEHSGKQALRSLDERAERVRKRGHESVQSSFVAGVTDISAPIMRGGRAVAAMTVPYLKTINPRMAQQDTTAILVQAAREISGKLPDGDSVP